MPSPQVTPTAISNVPDALGRFGRYGGRYVPETLSAALDQLERAYEDAQADPSFSAKLDSADRRRSCLRNVSPPMREVPRFI